MGDVMKKRKKLNESLDYSNNDNKGRLTDIFFSWREGSNVVRFLGDFLEVRTHYMAPNKARGDKGFAEMDVFKNKTIPYMVNCPDWDIENETEKSEKTCPICKLSRIARSKIKANGLSDDEKKFYKALADKSRARRALKWNVIDREDPFAIQTDEQGNEKKVPALKIATIGIEAWRDIDNIFDQVGFDITDEENGIDIMVKKDSSGARTTYSAQVILEGGAVKKTPLSDDEKKLVQHSLPKVCGKVTESSDILAVLHDEYAKILNADAVPSNNSPETPASTGLDCFGTFEGEHEECQACGKKKECEEATNSK
jgi:hypothetical protein